MACCKKEVFYYYYLILLTQVLNVFPQKFFLKVCSHFHSPLPDLGKGFDILMFCHTCKVMGQFFNQMLFLYT